jgi:hypothetical protein
MTGTKKTITMVGGAVALALAVGFGGVGVTSLGSTTAPTTHPASSVAPAPANGAARGVHNDTLTGFIGNNFTPHPYPPPHPHPH